ncbi:NADP-dependent oxidoreductase [Streptosporangium sp. NPDC051022]|uniref:NADP-dependent oxidoreductase n=1 Tax=Streptosporangium sp. NPDC051022 TaxID=3155752 RepID=UPI003420E8BF
MSDPTAHTDVPADARSIVFSSYGEPEELRLTETPVPQPGPGQVLLRVRAAGVNPVDWKIRAGLLKDFFSVPLPHVPGLEGAGVVVALGEGVTARSVGDEVFGPITGAYAEYALADADRLAAKPADLTWEAAAGVYTSAETAARALDLLKVGAGETLLVHGAAGSVGGLVIQFAVAAGARVVGTASEANHDYLRELGAIPVVYGDGVFDRVREAAPEGVNAVLDAVGGAVAGSVELLGGPERVVSIVAPAEAESAGARFTGAGDGEDRTEQAHAQTLALHAAGTLNLPIRATFPLAEAAEAHRLSAQGHGRGKIVLLP